MPKEAEIKPNQILADLKVNSPSLEMRSSREEPIAFGLVALIADIITDDVAGAMDKVEEALRASTLVGEFEVLGTSRISATVRK
jgi:translation elongation factor EF-1beta